MKVTKTETKESTKHSCGYGYHQKDSAEHEGEGGAHIGGRTTENTLTNTVTEEKKLLEEIVTPENLNLAYQRVRRKKGAGGVDGMSVEELRKYLKENGEAIRQSILAGKYKPSPVKRVEIPKEAGKTRKLGIPTAVDRVIQQAIAQVISPIYEEKFMETSYGFRPGKSAHDALKMCQMLMDVGYVWAVDMDLEKFFDTVNQSKLVELLSREIKDGRMISLIHKYLRAGVVYCGRFEETRKGVPQGGPLSPLLANILLNELDHELARRKHWFIRYADDLLILCKSKASAEQALKHIKPYIEKKLFLKVNMEKTEVAYVGNIKFLGYGFYKDENGYQMRVHKKTVKKLQEKVRQLTDRSKSYAERKEQLRKFIIGWVNYYRLAKMEKLLKRTDEWMRRRIRMNIWKMWKKTRTRYTNLEKLGVSHENAGILANSRKGCWRLSSSPILHVALSNKRLEKAGYLFFSSYYKSVKV